MDHPYARGPICLCGSCFSGPTPSSWIMCRSLEYHNSLGCFPELVVYQEFMPPEDKILPAEEQPLPAAVSPTSDSPGYVPESDLEEDPEDDDDEDPEEDPADYLVDGEDDGDMHLGLIYMLWLDSEDSMVTYTAVSSPFVDLPDIGSPGVDGPPVIPEDPYTYVVAAFQASLSPDYVSGPEYPLLPNFIPESVYLEFMPPEDEVLPAEEQPLPAIVSPTTDSPGYVPESDLEEDQEDEDNDPEEDPANYPADGGDDGDDKDESSDDDEDDNVDIEEDEEEEEHPAPADSTAVALPAVDQAPSAEETEPFKTDESVARLLAIPTPPPSPLSPWSSPLPQIPSPPLPLILSPLPLLPPLPISSPPPSSPIRLL
ncbi:hypothetical protein Tco_1397929, partial [Tanacetum coccineum]